MGRIVPGEGHAVELQGIEAGIHVEDLHRNVAQELLTKRHVADASVGGAHASALRRLIGKEAACPHDSAVRSIEESAAERKVRDRKNTRLDSSHTVSSYAVIGLQKRIA